MKKETIRIIILSGLLTGCTSTLTKVEPTKPEETLIIGRAEFNCSNSPRGHLSAGIYRTYLTLQFQNIETEENYTIYTEGENGFFIINNPSVNVIKLKKITAKDFSGASAFLAPNDQNIYTLRKGKVNNLGLLACTADLVDSEYDQTFNAGYEDTMKLFSERFPDSEWNNREWVNIDGKKQNKPSTLP